LRCSLAAAGDMAADVALAPQKTGAHCHWH